MRKPIGIACLAGMAFLGAGCGGGGSSSSSGSTSQGFLVGSLPDGSAMALTVDPGAPGEFGGDIAASTDVSSEGVFAGTIEGKTVHADGRTVTGTIFTLDGTLESDGSYDLTRSDLPGTTIHFVKPAVIAISRGQFETKVVTSNAINDYTATFATPGTRFGSATRYQGTWRGHNAEISDYGSSVAVNVSFSDYDHLTLLFSNYSLADLTSKKCTPSEQVMNIWHGGQGYMTLPGQGIYAAPK